jgi:hypothetical protein
MKLSKGKFYLFEERVPLRTHQVLRKELDKGRKALYISKNPPRLLSARCPRISAGVSLKSSKKPSKEREHDTTGIVSEGCR